MPSPDVTAAAGPVGTAAACYGWGPAATYRSTTICFDSLRPSTVTR